MSILETPEFLRRQQQYLSPRDENTPIAPYIAPAALDTRIAIGRAANKWVGIHAEDKPFGAAILGMQDQGKRRCCSERSWTTRSTPTAQ